MQDLISLLLFVFYLLSLLFLMQFSRCIQPVRLAPCGAGGDNENRTRDLLLARQALSQLSYAPMGTRDRALKIEQ